MITHLHPAVLKRLLLKTSTFEDFCFLARSSPSAAAAARDKDVRESIEKRFFYHIEAPTVKQKEIILKRLYKQKNQTLVSVKHVGGGSILQKNKRTQILFKKYNFQSKISSPFEIELLIGDENYVWHSPSDTNLYHRYFSNVTDYNTFDYICRSIFNKFTKNLGLASVNGKLTVVSL
jgi:hypothetical protein